MIKKYNVTVNGNKYEVEVESLDDAQNQAQPAQQGIPVPTSSGTARASFGASSGHRGAKSIKAPMPGTVLKINVKDGDHIRAGQVLLVLEAMKMENEITASENGTVANVKVSVGSTVATGAELLSYN